MLYKESVMKKNKKILDKVLTTLSHMQSETERMDYMLYYVNRLLNAEDTRFLTKHQIPKRGLTKHAWQARKSFFVNNIRQDDRYDKNADSYGENIDALLFYPIQYEEEYIGLLVSLGKESYDTTEEKMIPLKSGDQTIGVTVKQIETHISAHQFTPEDIIFLNELLPILIKAVYPRETAISEKREETLISNELNEKEKHNILKNTFYKMKQFFGNKY